MIELFLDLLPQIDFHFSDMILYRKFFFQTLESLKKALHSLEQIRQVPIMLDITKKTSSYPTLDEIDEIVIIMKRFLAKLRVQVSELQSS